MNYFRVSWSMRLFCKCRIRRAAAFCEESNTQMFLRNPDWQKRKERLQDVKTIAKNLQKENEEQKLESDQMLLVSKVSWESEIKWWLLLNYLVINHAICGKGHG